MLSTDNSPTVKERQQWLKILANADGRLLQQLWQNFTDHHPTPDYQFIRQPETGLTMVRSRIGGTGQLFNLGEMTVTRCALRLSNGVMGVSYINGRNHQHCETAALVDALLQNPATRQPLRQQLIEPLAQAQNAIKQQTDAEVRSTKVDFFTLVRGED